MLSFHLHPEFTIEELPDSNDFARFHPFIKGVFSQWHQTPFELKGYQFGCAEQWMMFAKASLFHDESIARAVLASNDPAEQKRLGQQVRNFDHDAWGKWRIDIVYRGNRAKFEQNAGALRQLQNTSPDMLVEANPRDWNWGNGLQIEDPNNQKPQFWKGTNLLGRILTKIRSDLSMP